MWGNISSRFPQTLQLISLCMGTYHTDALLLHGNRSFINLWCRTSSTGDDHWSVVFAKDNWKYYWKCEFWYALEIVQDLLMFLLRSSAVDGTYSFALDFRLPGNYFWYWEIILSGLFGEIILQLYWWSRFHSPLLGMNSLTHSPLAAAISLQRID